MRIRDPGWRQFGTGPGWKKVGSAKLINANFFLHYSRCLFNTLWYSQGQIITLEVEDFG
jgi:hypothetical protein